MERVIEKFEKKEPISPHEIMPQTIDDSVFRLNTKNVLMLHFYQLITIGYELRMTEKACTYTLCYN